MVIILIHFKQVILSIIKNIYAFFGWKWNEEEVEQEVDEVVDKNPDASKDEIVGEVLNELDPRFLAMVDSMRYLKMNDEDDKFGLSPAALKNDDQKSVLGQQTPNYLSKTKKKKRIDETDLAEVIKREAEKKGKKKK